MMDLKGDVDDLIDVCAEDDSLLSSPAVKDNPIFDFTQSPATTVRHPRPSATPVSIERCGESKEQSTSCKDVLNCQANKQSNVLDSAIKREQPPLCRESKEQSALHKGVLNCQVGNQSNMTNPSIEGEQPPLCAEDIQLKRKRRAGQYNLRKSLAWDKAFFTNEGVLNPAELSLLNKTFKTSNEALLPCIEEEGSVRTSLDSNCSHSGDNFALECLEEKLFTEPHTSKQLDVGVDKSQNDAFSEPLPAKPQLPPLPNAKILATGKRQSATKVVKSPEKQASHGSQDSFILKRSMNKGIEELQKPSQLKDASGKSCAPASPVVSKNAPTGHKRRKYTHGNVVSANGTRASTHRSSPSMAKESFGIRGRSDHLDSANDSASSCMHFETVKELALGATDLNRIRTLPKTYCSQSPDGISDLVSSTVSNDLTISNSKSVLTSHSCHEQSIPKIDAGIARDSKFSERGKEKNGIEKATTVDFIKADCTSIDRSSMIFTAKAPPKGTGRQCGKENNGFEKATTVDLPIKSDSTTTSHRSMVFTTKDPPKSSGSARTGTFGSKPSGLRMPAPKHGFFDTEKVICAPHPALQKRSSSSRILPPKSMPRGPSDLPQTSRLKPPGVPVPHTCPSYKGTAPSSISMASHLRPESASMSSIASIPSPALQPLLKANLEASGLGLQAHQKFAFSSKDQKASSDQRSDKKQTFSDDCNAYEAVIAEHNESKLKSSFSQVYQHNQNDACSVLLEEKKSQLCLLQQKCNLQDTPQTGPQQRNENLNDTEMSPEIKTGQVSNMNDISNLRPNRHEVADSTINAIYEPSQFGQLSSTHGDVAKTSEESMFKGAAKEFNSNPDPLALNSNLLKSDKKQTFSDACNAYEAVIAEHNESKLKSSFSQVNQHNQNDACSVLLEEKKSQLCLLQQKCNLQDTPQTGPQQRNENLNDTETSPEIKTGQVSNMNDIRNLRPNRHEVADSTINAVYEPSQFGQLSSTHRDVAKTSEETMFKGAAKEFNSNTDPLALNSNLLNSPDQVMSQKHVNELDSSMVSTERPGCSPISSPVLDDIAEKENIMLEGQHPCMSSTRISVDDLNVQVQNTNNSSDAPPFSEEWFCALEDVGEEFLQMKRGPVQNSPREKMVPQPGPWSPVRRHSQQLGPFDCTKYTNALGGSVDSPDQ